MGGKGPPKTPTNILKTRGSWRANTRKAEPTPAPGRPTRPAWLKGVAAKKWAELVPQLDDMGVLTKIDGTALSRYCALWARWRDAEDWIAENSDVVEWVDKQGVPGARLHPKARVASDLATHLHRLEAQFGLTPSARASLTVQPKPAESTLERYKRKSG